MKKIIFLTTATIFGFSSFLIARAQSISLFDLVNLADQRLGDISAYSNIKIIDAWNFVNQAAPLLNHVNVGIFDSGIDMAHPEFNGVDVQSTISKDMAIDFFHNGHGTEVAGIIGANNISFSGVYVPPQMNGILSGIRGLGYTLQIRSKDSFAAFTTSTDNMRYFAAMDQLARSPGGIQIINASFGAPLCFTSNVHFVETCYELAQFNSLKSIYTDLVNQYSSTTLFIFAAGNDGINSNEFLPGGGVFAANIIDVGATDLADGRAVFSNFGPTVNLAAPGVKIYAPSADGQYVQDFNGTSAAAPMVTGVAAILKSIKPALMPADIKQILQQNADPLFAPTGSDEAGKQLGFGCPAGTIPPGQVLRGCRLNALKAVQAVLPPIVQSTGIWPMLQHDAQHTGRSGFTGPLTGNTKWLFTLR